MMRLTFDQMFEALLELEGFESNHPNDPGGETTWGIAKAFHPEMYVNGPPTKQEAYDFYHREYYIKMRLAELDSGRVAFELLEASVLCGKATAVRFAQRAFNLIKLRHMESLVLDGIIGPKTIHALNTMSRNYESAMYRAMNHFQAKHFENVGSEDFVRGWFERRLDDADLFSS